MGRVSLYYVAVATSVVEGSCGDERLTFGTPEVTGCCRASGVFRCTPTCPSAETFHPGKLWVRPNNPLPPRSIYFSGGHLCGKGDFFFFEPGTPLYMRALLFLPAGGFSDGCSLRQVRLASPAFLCPRSTFFFCRTGPDNEFLRMNNECILGQRRHPGIFDLRG